MRHVLRLFVLLLAIVLCMGCARRRQDSEIDKLWKAGYGFNNPNPDRLKKGLPPQNFNGTVSD